jgi:DNA-binding MarR family transcriptional regulator
MYPSVISEDDLYMRRKKRRYRGVFKMGKTGDQVLQLLNDSGPLTLAEIAEKLDKKPKAVFRALRKLFAKGEITTEPGTRKYVLVEE